MGAAIGLVALTIIIVVLWNVYVGLYGAPPLAIRDGPFGRRSRTMWSSSVMFVERGLPVTSRL